MAGTLSEGLLLLAMQAVKLTRAPLKICGISTLLMRPLDTWFWRSMEGVSALKCVLRGSILLIALGSLRVPLSPQRTRLLFLLRLILPALVPPRLLQQLLPQVVVLLLEPHSLVRRPLLSVAPLHHSSNNTRNSRNNRHNKFPSLAKRNIR